jgi:tight adherence protein C
VSGALAGIAALLLVATARELLVWSRSGDARRGQLTQRIAAAFGGDRGRSVATAALRLGIPARLRAAGLEGRIGTSTVLAAKACGAVVGAATALVAAPAAPGRLSFLVGVLIPAAGFLAPDALLERRARHRRARLVSALPDALDLLAVGTASGRSPARGLAEISSTTSGPLAAELGVFAAEVDCGVSQSVALRTLRTRVGGGEVAAMAGALERSSAYGSPLADQLRDQASGLRRDQRRRIEERAARAAPKIQLAVALLLVPSVLLIIAAGLIANSGALFAV